MRLFKTAVPRILGTFFLSVGRLVYTGIMYELLLSLKFAFKSLTANFLRTLLTLSGIIIGTVAVVAVVSFGDAVKGYVLGQVEGFGSDTIQVEIKNPSTSKNSTQNATSLAAGLQITTLKVSDAEAIARLQNVSTWYAGVIGQELASYQNVNKRIMLLGASSTAPDVDKNVKVAEGSFYTEGEDRGAAQVIVIGSGVRKSFFGDAQAVGRSIKIKGQSYKVVGVLKERGSTGFVSFDDFVYVPLGTLQKKILGVDYVSFITVKARSESVLDDAVRDIEALLRERHDIDDPNKDDFAVTTVKEAQEMIRQVFGAVNILLLALASVSLIVGGVGIMNVMFVAVAERTGEIGLRKAVGARSKDILWQFLVEALIVALAGGAVGIALAELLLFGVFQVLQLLGFSLAFPFSLNNIFLALGFALTAGLCFGVYPAWKASQISPMQAIRQE
jgi:putative ABC transport system permease protein